MTVVSVSFDGTRLDTADTATKNVWQSLTGADLSDEPDLVYQGNGSVSEKVGVTEDGCGYYYSTTIDMQTTPRIAMIKGIISNVGILNNEGSTGCVAQIGDANTNTDFYEYYIAGKDTWPPSQRWMFAFIDPNVTAYRDATDGTAPDLTAAAWWGFGATFSGTSKIENVAMDAFDYVNSGKGLTLTAGTGTDPEGTFQDFVDEDEGNTSNRWGVVFTMAGAVFCNLTLTIGSATATEFDSANESVTFTGLWLDSGAQGIAVDLQNASTVVTITSATLQSIEGRDNLKRFFDTDHQIDTPAADNISITAHGFEDGDAVLYSKEGGTQAIGLTDATEYFVEAESDDAISLHTTRQGAMTSGTPISLTPSTSGNGENHSIRRQPYTTPHFTQTGTSGSMTVTSCNFIRFGDSDFSTTPTFTSCKWVDPKYIDPNGATFTNCTFDGATTVEGEALMDGTVTEFEEFSSCDFIAGDWGGHAWEVTGTVSALDISSLTWTGYGNDPGDGNGMAFNTETAVDIDSDDRIDYTNHGWASGDPVYYSKNDPTDGTLGTEAIGLTDDALYYVRAISANEITMHNTRYAAENGLDTIALTKSGVGNGELHTLYSADAAIVNNTGGDMAINVTGGTAPSVRNIDGATSTVNISVAIEINGMTEGSRAVMIGDGGAEDGVILLQGYANAAGKVTGSFSGTTPQDVIIRARNGGIINAAIMEDNGTGFTDYTDDARDKTGTNDVLLLPTTPASSDAFYFGGLAEFEEILIKMTTAGSGLTLVWEYSQGASSWSTLTVSDGTSNLTATGWKKVTFTAPGDWATDTVNSQGPFYYVRVRVTGVSSPTQPKAEEITLNETVKYLDFEGSGIIAATVGLTSTVVWQEDSNNP